jgi:hypothetical protein
MNIRSRRVLVYLLLVSAGAGVAGSGCAIAQETHQPAAQWAAAPLAYYPAVPAAPGWVTGAGIGSLFGAMLSASNPVVRCAGLRCVGGFDPRPVLLGALIGGLIGHAESQPRMLPMTAAPGWRGAPPAWSSAESAATPAAVAPAAPSDAAASTWFFEHWHRFASPQASGSSAAGDSGAPSFIERWQRFAEPYRK